MPYRYRSESERIVAEEEALRIEVVPTEAAATIRLQPGIADVLMRTRTSSEFELMRRSIDTLGRNPDSTLLSEPCFREAWRNLCAVYAENSATLLEPSRRADHRAAAYAACLYVLARVVGILILPAGGPRFDVPVVADAAVIEAMVKFRPKATPGVPRISEDPDAPRADDRVSWHPLLDGASERPIKCNQGTGKLNRIR